MIITSDIGASKVRVGAFNRSNGKLQMTRVRRYKTKEWEGIIPVLKTFLEDEHLPAPELIAIGMAGPVSGDLVRMTNLPWTLETRAIEKELRCRKAIIVNDLVAHAYGISELTPDDYVTIREGKPKPGNRALIAAGSGLGECILHWDGNTFLPAASEGGHCTFSPRNLTEVSLLQFLMKKYPEHVSFERAVSGHYGFRNLYDFLRQSKEEDDATSLSMSVKDNQEIGPELLDAAERGSDIAKRTLALFFECYGSEAGNLALKALALNGVYLAGGIAREMLPWLKQSGFLDAFTSKGRMTDVLREVPVHVVIDRESPIKGLARCAEAILSRETPTHDQDCI